MYIICYDIQDNKLRTRIAKLLLSHGERIQKSVFACAITERQVNQLMIRLEDILQGKNDILHIYRLGADSVRMFGKQGQQMPMQSKTIII